MQYFSKIVHLITEQTVFFYITQWIKTKDFYEIKKYDENKLN